MTYVEFPGHTNRPRIYNPTVTERAAVAYWRLRDNRSSPLLFIFSYSLTISIIIAVVIYSVLI